jgi:hypothetical protein
MALPQILTFQQKIGSHIGAPEKGNLLPENGPAPVQKLRIRPGLNLFQEGMYPFSYVFLIKFHTLIKAWLIRFTQDGFLSTFK